MDTYETVHGGDIVLGHDGELWGVERIEHEPRIAVTLVKGSQRVTGYPPPGTPITVVQRADVSAEHDAAAVLLAAGLGPLHIISERWER